MGLDSVEIVMNAERLFNVELPDKVVEGVVTFGEFVECVFAACREREYKIDRDEVTKTLRKSISDHMGIPEKDIRPESRFVDDLGVD